MITIGILFCDRDLVYLQDFLRAIPYKVKIPYEVILLDNRTDTSSDISFLNSYNVLNKGQGNLYQLAGRKKIIENATGDYVWFVDPDDTLFEIGESFNEILFSDYDFISFSYLIKSPDGEFWNEVEDRIIQGDLLRPEANNTPCCLWNKWIKTNVLRQVIDFIPDSARVSASEDLIYVLGALKYSNSQLQCSKYTYTFNSDSSCSGLLDYSGQTEKFRRCIFGLAEANSIIRNFMTEEDLKSLEIDLEKNDCNFFLKKVLKTENKTDQTEMFTIVKNNFSDTVIKDTWLNFLYSQEMTESQYQQMDELLAAEYGEEIGTTEITTTYIWDDGRQETVVEDRVIKPEWLEDLESTDWYAIHGSHLISLWL
ncbi:MAG: glycosyltransferase family 2 protein [Treponema sp.]|nr:glycosyltransferase family 2 protein [Treponema sp.]